MRRYQLTKNFYLDEFTRSSAAARLGIDNNLADDSEEAHNLFVLCENILQPLRDVFGSVHITSGYRSTPINTLIGGSLRSQHVHGLAADIVVTGHTPLVVCRWIYSHLDTYDQLIHEFGQWTHVSIAGIGEPLRRQPLTAYHDNDVTHYVPGITSIGRAS